MARGKTQKNQNIDVTIKPWWQTQLFGALVGAIIAGLFSLIPWYYSLKNEKWMQSEIDRKVKSIQNDNFGLSILANIYPDSKWTFNKIGKVKIKVVTSIFDKRESWIALRDPINNRDVRYSRGVHQGKFYSVIDNLNCEYTYPYRAEALHNGRVVFGPLGYIQTVKCETETDRSAAIKSPYFSPDL
jgi:hypothetical protein